MSFIMPITTNTHLPIQRCAIGAVFDTLDAVRLAWPGLVAAMLSSPFVWIFWVNLTVPRFKDV
jgi:hypothetical protein